MNTVVKRIQIDLYSPTCYEVIKAQQGDNASRVIEFEILNQGEAYDLSDMIARMEGHRGDGTSFIKDCTISENIVSITLDNDILYDEGHIEAKIALYDISSISDDGEIEYLPIVSTIPFKIYVQKNPCDKSIAIEKQSVIDYILSAITILQKKSGGVSYSPISIQNRIAPYTLL